MITIQDLRIYKRYQGDEDMFLRAGNKKKETVNDWSLIDTLVQDLILIQNGNASLDYIENVNSKLHQSCKSEETIEELRRIAKAFAAQK